MSLVGLTLAALLGADLQRHARALGGRGGRRTETWQEAKPFVDVVHPVGDAPDQTLVLLVKRWRSSTP